MKALFIGGTGIISNACVKLAAEKEMEVTVLCRGNSLDNLPEEVKVLKADIKNEEEVESALKNQKFDVVADFVSFTEEDAKRNHRIFSNKTKQYIFISSASAYEKPSKNLVITENTPLENPFWEYSRNKIKAEEFLIKQYKETGFPVVIVRPSHTYCERKVPVAIHGKNGSHQILKRIKEGKPIIVHGDGESVWTMTHSKDFAKGFVGLFGNEKANGEAFHITADESLSWNEIYKTIADEMKCDIKIKHITSDDLAVLGEKYDLKGTLLGDKATSVYFDNSKIKKFVPEFSCEISMQEGLREAVRYALDQEEQWRLDLEFEQWCNQICNNYI